MNINNLNRYSYYSSLWNNNISTSRTPNINSVSQAVKNAYKAVQVNNTSTDNISNVATAASLKTDAEQLTISAKKITNNTDSGTFAQKVALSEDSSKITATAKNTAYNTTYELKVEEIAKAQVNTSNVMDKSQVTSLQAGTNSITITAGGASKDIDFSVTAGDNNETVLNKMAKAINSSQSGVNAVVIKSNSNNDIKLQITSDKTGTNNVFSINDKVGNAAASTGINNISSNAVDAKYQLNGIDYTSNSNIVTTDKGRVTFNLKNSTTDTVKVAVKQDSNKIEDDIYNFVEDYNNLIKDAQKNGIDNSSALKGITSIVDRNKSNLSNIGITINEDHTLSVDKKKLTDKIDTDMKTVKETFNSYQGVATKVQNYSNTITKNPFTAVGVNTLDVYNKGLITAYSYLEQGSILNLYR